MTPSIDQTLHLFANLLPNWTLIPILTLLPNFGGFHRTLQRVRLANRGRLLLRTPGPVPFGTCICSGVETVLSWACRVYGPFGFRASLGASILLLIHLVKIIFTNIKLCVIQHGFFSEFFSIGRSCRQGDPASPYIFRMCVEIIGLMIMDNSDTTGIYIFNTEYKLIQYADDTTIILDGSEKSLNAELSLVNQFSKFSGLKPNYNKTCCVKIGSIRSAELNFVNRYDIQWTQDPFTFLGIPFIDNLANIIDLNYTDKNNSIRKVISASS